MKMNELYIKQTNEFCEANCKITAQDILAKAKQKQSENTNVGSDNSELAKIKSFDKTKEKTSNKKSNLYLFSKIAQAAAACIGVFLLSGTTILAVNGDLGTFIRNIFTNKTTAEIIEQGYVYAIDDFDDCGNFALKLVAISGDKQSPQIIMDVYMKDEALAAANDRIFLTAQVLGVEVYENDREHYAILGAYGTKDEEVTNLYHVTFEGAPAWLMPDSEAVIAVQDIFTDIDPKETGDISYWSDPLPDWGEPPFTVHEINHEFKVTVPEGTFASVPSRKYHSVVLEGRNYDYVLDCVDYGHYTSYFVFYFNYPEGVAPANNDEKIAIEDSLYLDWLRVGTNITITVDGTEYKFAQDGGLGSINWNYNGTTNNLKRAYIYAELPAIDYYGAESITLKFNDQVFDLKEGE